MPLKKSMYDQLEELERRVLLSKLVELMHKDNHTYFQVVNLVNGGEANGKLDNVQFLNDIHYKIPSNGNEI